MLFSEDKLMVRISIEKVFQMERGNVDSILRRGGSEAAKGEGQLKRKGWGLWKEEGLS